MSKPYIRGRFRAIKVQPKPDEFPKYWCYDVQAQSHRDPGQWVTIESCDYLGNARLRVRNLAIASMVTHHLSGLPEGPEVRTNGTAFFEDNNGGDVIEILKFPDGKFEFKVGWQCVWFIGKTGTISEIAEWLAKMEEPLTKAGYPCRAGL